MRVYPNQICVSRTCGSKACSRGGLTADLRLQVYPNPIVCGLARYHKGSYQSGNHYSNRNDPPSSLIDARATTLLR
ncbi:hypothetical protein EMIT043CA1_60123 [Pseudomonas brassicacearum]